MCSNLGQSTDTLRGNKRIMAKRAERRQARGAGYTDEAPFNPVEILKDWWNAIVISATALADAPLRILGVETAKLKKDQVATSVRGFPVVGLAFGLIAAIVYTLTHGLGLPPLIAALLAVATLAFLGGAGNEGELARLADALIAGGNKAQQLARLKEEALGSYGIVVLVICLGLRVGALTSIGSPGAVTAALVAALPVSFAAVTVVLYYLPAARRSGFAYLAGRPRMDQTVLAALLAATLALLVLGPVTAVVALAVGALGALKFAWFAKRNLGGTTRAVLGAVQQGTEIGVLLAIVALA
jgi:adenosylcobinamide-GDP ribazoletransferase